MWGMGIGDFECGGWGNYILLVLIIDIKNVLNLMKRKSVIEKEF